MFIPFLFHLFKAARPIVSPFRVFLPLFSFQFIGILRKYAFSPVWKQHSSMQRNAKTAKNIRPEKWPRMQLCQLEESRQPAKEIPNRKHPQH
jgi:hypothetical protein